MRAQLEVCDPVVASAATLCLRVAIPRRARQSYLRLRLSTVPEFINQSLGGLALKVHGDGSQTRSLCYVEDLIEGFWALVNSEERGPVNIGNPHEITVLELAESIIRESGSPSDITFIARPIDDPERRCPDLTLARERLGWEPKVPLDDGLARTIKWARSTWIQEETQ
jgi:nucleoside-diphosphate-sugar epimerase